MNRLDQTFAAARNAPGGPRKLLCPFLTAGYPSLESTIQLLLATQEALGDAGVIEFGVPFSDPVADGPVIQASYTEALAKGATVEKCLRAVALARQRGLTLPVVAMVSFSIIFKRGTREFASLCVENQLDGMILPDVPLEEATSVAEAIRAQNLRTCLLVAPTTPPSRRAEIVRLCDGFVYYLSVSGITGERTSLPNDVGPNVLEIRKITKTPICVGFGISTPEHVREVTKVADGAIVGSAVIRKLREVALDSTEKQASALGTLLRNLASGLHQPV